MKISQIFPYLAASIIVSACNSSPVDTAPRGPLKIDIDSSDHIRGKESAPVSLVEYSDFECPFCRKHHPTLMKLLDEYDTDVNWVYRHYPISFLHPTAQKAAEASECANELGGSKAFWKYADLLFQKGSQEDALISHAKEIQLNEKNFQNCLDSGKYEQKIKDQLKGGQSLIVKSTPTTFVVDNATKEAKPFPGLQPIENFRQEIDSILKK